LRKTFYIPLIFLLIHTSCQTNKDLKGTWISAYEFDATDTLTASDGIHLNQIITFEDKYCTIKEFKFFRYEDFRRNRYSFKNGKLRVLNDSIEALDSDFDYGFDLIKPLTKDSLVLTNEMSLRRKRVYKKLHDSLKNKSNKISLSGKSFVREFDKLTDTITFVNDSIFKNTSFWIDGTGNTDLHWERISHFGYDIVFMDYTIPYIVKKEKGNTIYLSAFDKIKIDFTLTELK